MLYLKRLVVALAASMFAVTALARPVTSVSTDYSITAANCDGDIIASGGQIKITLPAPIANCDIVIINNEAGNGKVLSNFPADVNPKLYPHQSVGVTSDGISWISKNKPGRYAIPAHTIIHVDPAGNDANDGLTEQTPVASPEEAVRMVQMDFDRKYTPIIALRGGTTNSGQLGLGGSITGANLTQLSVYGTGTATITYAGPPIMASDGSWWDIRVDGLGSNVSLIAINTANTEKSGVIYVHNDGGFDVEGDITLVGTGTIGSTTNGSAIFYDGMTTGAAIVNGIKFQGVFGDVIRMDVGGRFTFGGELQPVPDAGGKLPWGDRLFAIYGTSVAIMGGQPAMGGWASLGQSIVGGNAVMTLNGSIVPGSVTHIQGGVIN
jgi:hypothetical protein